jgi:hypothetical protein
MPKPLNVDWPAVRVLAVAVAVREAARQIEAATFLMHPDAFGSVLATSNV